MEFVFNKKERTVEAVLHGSVTFNDHQRFREMLLALAALKDTDAIEINMHAVDFLDSAGIGMLIIANDEAQGRNQKLVVCGVRDQVKMALDVADIQSLFEVREA